jgi:hypothetical protein
MNRVHLSRAAIVATAAVGIAAASLPAYAGSVGGNGGSTEITQLVNEVQLIKSNVSQISTVENTLQSAMALKQTLKQLDPATLARMSGVSISDIQAMAKMDGQLGGLMDSAQSVQAVLTKAVDVSQQMKITPAQYLAERAQQAQKLGGMYAQSFNNDRASMQEMQTRIADLQSTAAAAPAVTSQVQGLQQLLAQNTQLQAQLISLNESVTKANTLAAMRGQEHEQTQADDAAAAAQAKDGYDALNKVEHQTITLPNPADLAPKNSSGNR